MSKVSFFDDETKSRKKKEKRKEKRVEMKDGKVVFFLEVGGKELFLRFFDTFLFLIFFFPTKPKLNFVV